MAMLEVKSSLNPEAPEFKPNKNTSFYHPLAPLFPHRYLQAPPPPIYPSPDPSFYYPVSTPPPSPYTQYPLYTNPYLTQPILQVTEVTEPAPPVASYEEPHGVHEPQVESEVMAQKGYQKGVKSGNRNRYFWKRKSGGREGFEGFQCYGDRQARRGKVCDGESHCCRNVGAFSSYPRKGQSWVRSRERHEVVPVQPDGQFTTVMIKNIPNRYTRELLLEFLDDHCLVENEKAKSQNPDADKEPIVSAYDFLYLPMDFKSRMNKGFAFVNFTDPRAVWKLHLATHNQTWPLFQSSKRCEIAYARLQGKEELVKKFKGMLFPCEEYLPVCFSPARDGSRELVKQSTVGTFKGNWEPHTPYHI